MMRALLLMLSCLADYETMRDLAHGAFMAGLVNGTALCGIGTVIVLRRLRLVRGEWLGGRYLIYY